MSQVATVGKPWKVGLLGCGVVGSAVVRALRDPSGSLVDRFRVMRVAVRDPDKPRDCRLRDVEVTTSPLDVAADPDLDVVIEAIGGVEAAGACLRSALSAGTPVVTGNKALLGYHGPELQQLADRHGVALRFEAAVAAAIPAVRTVGGYLAHDRIERIDGILNGTSNYILTCADDGVDLDDALAQARARGFAEADATRDLDGRDAADKLAILGQVVWGHDLRTPDVHTTGIDRLDTVDIERERGHGRVWRLIASITEDGRAHVEPRPVAGDHPFAQVRGPDNALNIHATRAGRLFLRGPGAGGNATATAIIADLTDLAAYPHPGPDGRRHHDGRDRPVPTRRESCRLPAASHGPVPPPTTASTTPRLAAGAEAWNGMSPG